MSQAAKEFVIVYMVEPFGTAPFQMWPLHMTLVPWFDAPDAESVVDALQPVISSFKPFMVSVGKREYFGARKLAVKLVDVSEDLQRLHERLLQAIEQHGWVVNGRYTGAHFKPHVTQKQGRDAEGELRIDSLHVVEALPQMYRQPVAELRLGHG